MFAVAIATGERLFLTRDYIGIKPLYYAHPENSDWPLYFASDLMAFAPLWVALNESPPGACYGSETGFHTYYLVPDRAPMELALAELLAGYRYYKDNAEPQVLRTEMRSSLTRLHNINPRRVDRMTMRHGIEVRVSFLDRKVIELGSTLPTAWQLTDVGGIPVEKWILRKAFEDMLPSDIVWRNKEQFDEGSGMVDLQPQLIGEATAAIDVPSYLARLATDRLRLAEECWYHQLLVDAFDHAGPVLADLGRWALD
jgi:asparagine synthetase B (glutamine-hydrolysing)